MNTTEYANMTSSMGAAHQANGVKGPSLSRPPASPPLQHAPPPPPPSSQVPSGQFSAMNTMRHQQPLGSPPTQAPPLPPHQPFASQRGYLRSPTTILSMNTPTPLDDELLGQLSRDELISRLKTIEARNRKLLFDNGAIMKDINMHISQLQQLKHQNFQLIADNNELRDLCCYLDDERSKARSIAREWQSFGNHMSRVMRQEINTYSSKLAQLEAKQFELVRENFELKQLCLLLDNAISVRENGDGSTGSMASNSEDTTPDDQNSGQPRPNTHRSHHRVMISQQILEYIRSLERRVQQLEWDKNQSVQERPDDEHVQQNDPDRSSARLSCPPAVAEAMRVLRIHDSLSEGTPGPKQPERNTQTPNELDDISLEQQRAIVRSLCNVAWRKIEEGN